MTSQLHARRSDVDGAVASVQEWIDRRQRTMFAHLHQCGHSPAQLHVLGVLDECGRMTVSQLATRLGISVASTSTIVDRMLDAGLVGRERSDEDRRTVAVWLTPAGHSMLETAAGARRDKLRRVLERLDPADVATLLQVMQRVETAIDEVSAAS